MSLLSVSYLLRNTLLNRISYLISFTTIRTNWAKCTCAQPAQNHLCVILSVFLICSGFNQRPDSKLGVLDSVVFVRVCHKSLSTLTSSDEEQCTIKISAILRKLRSPWCSFSKYSSVNMLQNEMRNKVEIQFYVGLKRTIFDRGSETIYRILSP